MLLTEYDEAEAMELFREKGRAEGRAEARAEAREEGRAEGRAEGRERLVENLMGTLGLTREQAYDALGIPEPERKPPD